MSDIDPAIAWLKNELIMKCGGKRIVILVVALQTTLRDQAVKEPQKHIKKPHIQTITAQKFSRELSAKVRSCLNR